MKKISKSQKGLIITVVASVAAVIVFYAISPKHSWEISIASPLPILP